MAATNRTKERAGSDAFEPISVRIPMAVAMTGFSRSRIYELIATGEIQIAKDHRSTVILVASLREAVCPRIVGRDLPIG